MWQQMLANSWFYRIFINSRFYRWVTEPVDSWPAWPQSRLYLVYRQLLTFLEVLAQKLENFLQSSGTYQYLVRLNLTGLLLLLVALYPIIDYILRTIGLLAGLWDELLFVLIVGLGFVYLLATQGWRQLKATPVAKYIILFWWGMLLLFFLRSPDTRIGLDGLRAVVEYSLWFFVAVNFLRDRIQIRTWLFVALLGAFLVAAYGLYQKAAGVSIPAKWVDQAERSISFRAFSIIGSPNVLGSYLMLFIPINLAFALSARRWSEYILYWGILAAQLLCLVYTYSRGAWLAFLLAMLVFGFCYNRRLLVAILALSLLVPVLAPSVGARISYMLSPQYIESSQKGGRLIRWTTALEKVEKRPAIGLGLGRFGGAVAAQNDIPGTFYVDNYYIKTLAETGLIGLALLLFVYFNAWRYAIGSYRRIRAPGDRLLAAGLVAGLTGVLAHNGVENIFEVPMMNTYFWFLLGMLWQLRENPGSQ
ncbi:O-antigen ligase [Carboxydocella sporoproducens DSM 16521]|uniref:O-antigen ligase n=2 Tax=Carboxydocella TaxID=178898 RepID=A0A1T4P071_9FIRM|nr:MULTISPECIES: O-antigen ligase family protein [Carboxydocella]AVX19599.1 O-antigen ligase [Carboxydocella thermautotrophica]SJZ84954.1 O-antigen ligase [Carboxydocella sporoproducens DSM 16521]